MLIPSQDEFLRATGAVRRMPVYSDTLADVETPLSAYWKLSHDEECSFLLESVTGGEQLARYSLLGVRPRKVLRVGGAGAENPLDLLREELLGSPTVHVPGLPEFIGGAVGLMSYDLVRHFEKLPEPPPDDLNIDDLAMMFCDTVVVFDHARNLIRVIVLAEPTEKGYRDAQKEIERVMLRLAEPLPPLPSGEFPVHPVTSNMDQVRFESMVERTREYIAAGDGIQMVLSQRFSTPVDAHPVTVYRALRSINPSPYMFLLRFGDFDLVGASPELLVSLRGDVARVRPIAGTRWRGNSPAEDDALAAELLADEKERAEHIMLVDLGRNDLGRVCSYGTVNVNELMVIERYSHVMHIVSDVTGQLATEKDAFELLKACFPAGTVSGAPKVRAMQIIDELEPTRRGPYAGSVGFFSATGDMDTCIAIRTILIKDGVAYVQAGAGIVYDSVPSKEFEETRNKARAALRAIEFAQRGLK
jgi:anthranilate synthase component 1